MNKMPIRTVELGVIEFHSPSFNPGLSEMFFRVVKDLRDSASIVDLWLMDIAWVLKQHGYTLTVTTDKPKPQPMSYRAAQAASGMMPRFVLGQKVTGAGWSRTYEITAIDIKSDGIWYQVGGHGGWYGELALCACDSYPPEPR